MNSRTNSGGFGAALSVATVALLMIGGGATLLFVQRHQAASAQQFAQGAAPATAGSDDAAQDDAVRAAVEAVLREQEAAWNGGDIDAFCEHYWKSDDVTFSSSGRTLRGWTQTRDGYRERYPTREKMGRVKFSNLETTPLGDTAAMILGEWSLERETEPLSGNFTLVFRKLDGRWVIVHDHTSRRAE